MEFLVAQLMQGQQAMQHMQMQQMQFMMYGASPLVFHHPLLSYPPPHPGPVGLVWYRLASATAPQSAPPSPSKLIIPNTFLDEFGSLHITKIQEKHWGSEGVKFLVISWMNVLEAHKKYLCDMRNGLWAE
ncbi:hypothetical protein BDP27DRAFT_1416104 [Rhodocollybia butyracea]|uniref:Uncharacterized protein n=1 Tax=Rhodocollybia butyracea TaxID=206335 RepID=A0A9P5UD12_9AGAR|nr:hypothetical protein BDP27DRAFT_1416104 [Rhodocollybia butyracea]